MQSTDTIYTTVRNILADAGFDDPPVGLWRARVALEFMKQAQALIRIVVPNPHARPGLNFAMLDQAVRVAGSLYDELLVEALRLAKGAKLGGENLLRAPVALVDESHPPSSAPGFNTPAIASGEELATAENIARLTKLLRKAQAERDELVAENIRLEGKLTLAEIAIESAQQENRAPTWPPAASTGQIVRSVVTNPAAREAGVVALTKDQAEQVRRELEANIGAEQLADLRQAAGPVSLEVYAGSAYVLSTGQAEEVLGEAWGMFDGIRFVRLADEPEAPQVVGASE